MVVHVTAKQHCSATSIFTTCSDLAKMLGLRCIAAAIVGRNQQALSANTGCQISHSELWVQWIHVTSSRAKWERSTYFPSFSLFDTHAQLFLNAVFCQREREERIRWRKRAAPFSFPVLQPRAPSLPALPAKSSRNNNRTSTPSVLRKDRGFRETIHYWKIFRF